MLEEAALLRTIMENPDDDTPRLVFADWLEEHGDPKRAEFIRTQIKIAWLPEYDPYRQRIRDRNYNLIFGSPWDHLSPELPEGIEWALVRHRRGFPDHIEVKNVDVLIQNAAELFKVAPLQRLKLDSANSDLAKLAQFPEFRRFRSFQKALGRLGAEPISALLNSEYAAGLTELTFRHAGIRGDALRALFSSQVLRNVEVLDFSQNNHDVDVGRGLAQVLPKIKSPRRLRKLDLSSTAYDYVIPALVKCPIVSTLEELNLSGNNLTERAYQALAESPLLGNLKSLALAKSDPRVGGIRALAGSPHLKNLRALNLSATKMGPVGLKPLVESEVVDNLVALHLNNNKIGDRGLKLIAGSPRFSKLVQLEVQGNKITDKGVYALAESPYITQLGHLRLVDRQISNAARDAIKRRYPDCFIM
jgi:uncharacterized protein (TIGR02996 family)